MNQWKEELSFGRKVAWFDGKLKIESQISVHHSSKVFQPFPSVSMVVVFE